jgi:hypothetical protein
MMADQRIPLIMEELTDPAELAGARARHERFAHNSAWLQWIRVWTARYSAPQPWRNLACNLSPCQRV